MAGKANSNENPSPAATAESGTPVKEDAASPLTFSKRGTPYETDSDVKEQVKKG